jgi:hypothetical protein
MKATIHQPEFLSYLGFFDKVSQVDLLLLLDSVDFRKNYYQNRNRIMGSNGPMWLTVPVEKHNHKPMSEVVIAPGWKRQREKYLKTIQQVYGKAPFYHSISTELEHIFMQDFELLVELNVNLMLWVFQELDMFRRFPIKLTSLSGVESKKDDLIADLCKHYEVTEYLAGQSGKDYLDEDKFGPIKVSHHSYESWPYKQFHSKDFVPGLSVLDALFCDKSEIKRRLRAV